MRNELVIQKLDATGGNQGLTNDHKKLNKISLDCFLHNIIMILLFIYK